MARKSNHKVRQRFVMYIPTDLRQEIEYWVKKQGITLAEFGREAFVSFLEKKRREERHAQLAKTCQLLSGDDEQIAAKWWMAESETWPR